MVTAKNLRKICASTSAVYSGLERNKFRFKITKFWQNDKDIRYLSLLNAHAYILAWTSLKQNNYKRRTYAMVKEFRKACRDLL